MKTLSTRTILAAAFLTLAATPLTTLGTGEITPPKIIQTEPVRFPPALELTVLSAGEVTLALKIDRTGALTDVLATGYTHEAFATEAIDAVRRWRYEPARRGDEPIDMRVNLKIHFSSQMRVVTLMPVDTPGVLLRRAGVAGGVNLVCPAEDLDSPVKVLHPATPVHPGRTTDLPDGRTVVDFYIDENGHARLPVVAESTHPAFALAALKAIEDWRFDAPTRKGRPVIVRTQQEFLFSNGS